jgi:hypothetical protein
MARPRKRCSGAATVVFKPSMTVRKGKLLPHCPSELSTCGVRGLAHEKGRSMPKISSRSIAIFARALLRKPVLVASVSVALLAIAPASSRADSVGAAFGATAAHAAGRDFVNHQVSKSLSILKIAALRRPVANDPIEKTQLFPMSTRTVRKLARLQTVISAATAPGNQASEQRHEEPRREGFGELGIHLPSVLDDSPLFEIDVLALEG